MIVRTSAANPLLGLDPEVADRHTGTAFEPFGTNGVLKVGV